MRAAREAWFESQLDLDPDAVVFIDKTATATNMARPYGRAPRGERCRLRVARGHDKTTTITAALRTSGLVTTILFEGATKGARLRAYVTDTLAPVLKPGDIVVLDNLQFHKVVGVREAIEAAGRAALYLPAYSPGFNPIEQAFSKLKALLRTAAARAVPDLWAAIARVIAIRSGQMPQRPHSGRIRRLYPNLSANSSRSIGEPEITAAICVTTIAATLAAPSRSCSNGLPKQREIRSRPAPFATRAKIERAGRAGICA